MSKTEIAKSFTKYLNKNFRQYDRIHYNNPIETSKGHITDIIKKKRGVWGCVNQAGGNITFELLKVDELKKVIRLLTREDYEEITGEEL